MRAVGASKRVFQLIDRVPTMVQKGRSQQFIMLRCWLTHVVCLLCPCLQAARFSRTCAA